MVNLGPICMRPRRRRVTFSIRDSAHPARWRSAMGVDRRRLLGLGAGAAVGATTPAAAASAPTAMFGLDASHFGLHAGGSEDQSRILQGAIDEAVRRGAPLAIAPGRYRAGNLTLPRGAQLFGVRGATRIVTSASAPLFAAAGVDHVTLAGIVLDGEHRALPDRGLLELE